MQGFQRTFDLIWKAYSGEAAWQAVSDLSRFHRIQASPGYRQAAQLVFQRLIRAGLQAEVLSYPADEHTRFWAWPSFQEWDCTEAYVRLVEPKDEARLLADFRADPISVIQRSTPFEGETEVVLLEDGQEEADYEGLDLAGKTVLSRGDLRQVVELAVRRRGAVGILSDDMRTLPPVRPEGDLADVRMYTSFWRKAGEPSCFGFALTPRQGQSLRRLLREGKTPVRVQARVSSRLYDGALEVVSATISGTAEDEVLAVAHLCHPLPSANDNASGAAAALEAARTLQALIASGELRPPRRTLRFLWLPEMTGTIAYLSSHELHIPRLVAGINLDMVGENQSQTGSSWLIERPPDAAASFAPELLASLRDSMLCLRGMPEVSPSHTGLGEYPLYRLAETPFQGGSDHYILSDPSVGVPTPTLIEWPDRYYHTAADTPDRTDPRSLARSGALAAAYVYWLGMAGSEEVAELGYKMVARFKAELIAVAQSAMAAASAENASQGSVQAELDRRLAYRLSRQKAALRTLERLAPIQCLRSELEEEVERAAQHELAWASGVLQLATPTGRDEEGLAADRRTALETEAAGLVPARRMRGPIPLSDHLHRLSSDEQRAWQTLLKARRDRSHMTLTALALYWADGARTVLEICDLVELETQQRDLELLVSYFRLLQKLGFVTWH